ncbi:MAG: (Fe-S)-binding protein [Deltaproteobacteria bacterium]|nr:MAG: (Fe-S)-binding protein [Deltaproteobacteria bacterium]
MSDRKEKLSSLCSACVRCGSCLPNCPTYAVTKREWAVARGRIAIISQGDTFPRRGAANHLAACLMCGSCTRGCPNGVDTPEIVRLARAGLPKGAGGFFRGLAMRIFLPSWRRMSAALSAGKLVLPAWAKRLPRSSGLLLRLARPKKGPRRFLPEPRRPFMHERKDIPAGWDGHGLLKVALFPGCASNFIYPDQSLAIMRLLDGRTPAGPKGPVSLPGLPARVAVPRGINCCGLMSLGAGRPRLARKLARRNVRALLPEGGTWPDVITTPCASCAYTLKLLYPDLLSGDSKYSERAQALAERVVPFSLLWAQFSHQLENDRENSTHERSTGQLVTGGDYEKGAEKGASRLDTETAASRITWHMPCHLKDLLPDQGIAERLLSSLPEATFQPAKADTCCGGGGLFSITHPELSLRIGRNRLEGLPTLQNCYVITECSGCSMQLQWLLGESGDAARVLGFAEAVLRFGEKNRSEAQD